MSLASLLTHLKPMYRKIYALLCGRSPGVLPWHYQWLPDRAIIQNMRRALPFITPGSAVLDVGCGQSPYKSWLPAGCSYTGLDIASGDGLPDIVIQPDTVWPVADSSQDVVLCTQVLEHAQDSALLLSEIHRVLRPGGTLILTVPFIYGEHGMPWDYRRYTRNGISQLLDPYYALKLQAISGKIGTVLGLLLLNWVDTTLSSNMITKILKLPLLPLWLVVSLGVNVIGWLLDVMDRTETVYMDCLYVGCKK